MNNVSSEEETYDAAITAWSW